MGQRLNLEIVDNNGVLANSYYHWSAYSGSAIALTESVISSYFDLPEDLSSLGMAVCMLQETGSGIYSEERERIDADASGRYKGIEFHNAMDRNRGLLSVTKPGIEETEKWEEGRVTVNIETETVSFGVVWEESSDEFNEEAGDDAFGDLEECSVDFDNISFEEFHEIRDVYEQYPDGFRTPNGYAVLWIG